MNKVMEVITVTAVVLAAGAAIPAHADSMSGKAMDKSMMSMDTNKDGMLSKAEVAKDKTMMGKFDKMDMNKDGMLDSTEMGSMGNSGSMGTGGSMGTPNTMPESGSSNPGTTRPQQ